MLICYLLNGSKQEEEKFNSVVQFTRLDPYHHRLHIHREIKCVVLWSEKMT